MKAGAILKHFQEIGAWVDWDHTIDRILWGDPEREITGIATAWTGTDIAIQEARAKGLNLFITHEHPFLSGYMGTPIGDQLTQKKKDLFDACEMTLLRCHDTWDRMPEYGITDAWAALLGFPTEPRPAESFYKICRVDSLTVEELGATIQERVRLLGQDNVLVWGDPDRRVKRLAVGTGAVTNPPAMIEMGADAMLLTDDGVSFQCAILWGGDADRPLFRVSHGASEKPGMQAMAGYLQRVFPSITVEYVDVDLGRSARLQNKL